MTVSAAHRRDLLWAMEEALRCGTTTAVIGEMRAGTIDGVAVRRLSLAAAESGTLALLLRTEPPSDASTAATRWVVGAAPSIVPGTPRLVAQLVRNRRGPTGTWIFEWSDSDGQFILATHAQPLAASGSQPTASSGRISMKHPRHWSSPANAAMSKFLRPWMTRQDDSASCPVSLWHKRAPCIPALTSSLKTSKPMQPCSTLLPTGACVIHRWLPAIRPDGLLLDISGCAHLYGGERELIADLSGRLEKSGFAYSLAIAGTIALPGLSRVMANQQAMLRRRTQGSRAVAAFRAATSAGDGRKSRPRRLEAHRRYP